MLTLLVGAVARPRRGPQARFPRELHLGARPRRVQGGDRPRHRPRPGPEAARDPHREGRLLPQHRRGPEGPSGHVGSDPGGRRVTIALLVGFEHFVPKLPGAPHRRGGGDPRREVPRARRARSGGRRTRPAGPAVSRPAGLLARCELLWPGALGIALMSFTETMAAGRAFARSDEPPLRGNRELFATGLANAGGALARSDAVGRRDVPDGRQPPRRSAHAARRARHGRGHAPHDAAPRAAHRPDAAGDARGGRHRLFRRADQAGGVRRHPPDPADGVPLGARGPSAASSFSGR